jgi:hypothetical protein
MDESRDEKEDQENWIRTMEFDYNSILYLGDSFGHLLVFDEKSESKLIQKRKVR